MGVTFAAMGVDARAVLAAQREAITARINAEIPQHADSLTRMLRDSIQLCIGGAAEGRSGQSRLGGAPDLERGSAWPEVEGVTRWEFIGQLDLADVRAVDPHERLPAEGLLSFFHGYHQDYYDVGRVIMTPPGVELVPVPPAKGLPRKAVAASFKPLVALPPYGSTFMPGQLDERADFYDAWRDEIGPLHGMLGFDRHYEEKLPVEGKQVLLRIETAQGAPYDIPECPVYYFFISDAALAAGRLDEAEIFAGVPS